MRVFGIDCGTEWTGYGVVSVEETTRGPILRPIAAGAIRMAKRDTLSERLHVVHRELSQLLTEHVPDAVAIEEVFYSVNAKSALKLGHVRGVALLAAAHSALPVFEYAPLKKRNRCSSWLRACSSWSAFPNRRMPPTHSPSPSAIFTTHKRCCGNRSPAASLRV
jgi:crossover junction endodeoxyribonuclease RuvC